MSRAMSEESKSKEGTVRESMTVLTPTSAAQASAKPATSSRHLMRKACFVAAAMFVVHLGASLVAALVMPVGETKIAVRSLTLDLIPDRSLPLVVDSRSLVHPTKVEVRIAGKTTFYEKDSEVIIKAPQKDACLYAHIGPGANDKLEILPTLPPKNFASESSLADSSEADRRICSWLLSIGDDKGIEFRPGDVLRLPWRTDGGPSPIQLGRASAIRGKASKLDGGFSFAPRDRGSPHDLTLASEWLDVVAIYRAPHGDDIGEIGVDIESGRPTTFEIDQVNKKSMWLFHRWWHFFRTFKAGADAIHSLLGTG
jgi:hypothetical protein